MNEQKKPTSKKVAIVGRGTASLLTAGILASKGHQVVIFHSPDKKALTIGESTTPTIAQVLRENMGLHVGELIRKGIVSPKLGVNFIGWGEVNEQFIHSFAASTESPSPYSFHIENELFNPYIHDHLKEYFNVTYVEKNVESHHIDGLTTILVTDDGDNYYFDFVVFCTGWCDDAEYIEPTMYTVDSAILYQSELTSNSLEDTIYTQHLATPDGWQFGLPFPNKKITKHGYLYNRSLSSKEEIIKTLNLSEGDYNHIEWKPRHSKRLLQSPSVAYNGNRLFFYEPLQALSLHYYALFARNIAEYLDNPTLEHMYTINKFYIDTIWEYQVSLAMHYAFGSKYQTEFWQFMHKQALNIISNIPLADGEVFSDFIKGDIFLGTHHSRIGAFSWRDLTYLLGGLMGQNIPNKERLFE